MRVSWAASLAGVLLLQGCVGGAGLDGLAFACQRTADCADGWACIEGVCRRDGAGGGGGGAVGGGAGGGTGGLDGGGGGGGEDAGPGPMDAGPAQLVMSPQAHGFGNVTVMTTSAPEAFVITNVGGAASGLVSVGLDGGDASRFTLDSTCVSALSPGGSCTATVRFAPTSTGPANTTLEVQASPGGALTASLTGLAVAPAKLALSRPQHEFGGVTLGLQSAPMSITVTNTGNSPSGLPMLELAGSNAGQFSISDTSCTAPLPPMGTCSLSVLFSPTTDGVQQATLTVSAAPGGAQDLALSGTGLLPAALTLSPSPVALPPTEQATAGAPRTITVTNTGGSTAQGLTTTIGGPNPVDFLIDGATNTCATGTLAAGAACTLVVRCRPVMTGPREGGLIVSSGAVSATAPLSCEGLPPAALTVTPNMQPFGDVSTGATATSVFLVRNTGGVTTGPISPLVSGQDFALDAAQTTCGAPLTPQASCLVAVRFSPTALAARSGTLGVAATPGGMATASLTGTGVQPGNLSVSPAANAFGAVLLNASTQPVVFTVLNTGAGATVTPTVQLSGDGAAQFAQTNTCTAPLAGGAACTVSVRFAPTARGAASAFLRVSAGSSVVTASLSGQGLAPAALSFDQTTLQFPDTVVNASAPTRTLTLTNSGDVTSSAISTTLAPGGFARQTDTCAGATLAPQASCAVEIAFSPYSGTLFQTTLTAAAQQGGNLSVLLSGTGLSPASLAVIPASGAPIDFGAVLMPGMAQQTVTVTNTGQVPTGPLTFGVTGADAAMFSTPMGTCVAGSPLAPGAMCALELRFTPSARGARSATLTIAATPGSARTRTLVGVGQQPATLAPAVTTRSLGQVDVGLPSAAQTWTVTNDGDLPTGALSLTNSNAVEVQVASSNCTGTLAPGASCTVTATMKPAGPGARSGTLTLAATPGGSSSLTLTAEGAWRLTLTALAAGGALSTADGRITGCTSSSPASSCSALYSNAAFVTVRARTANGAGAHFAGWQAPAACAVGGTGSDCGLTVTAHQGASARFRAMTYNLAFVSSSFEPADRGGVSRYDARCNALATAAGINTVAGDGFIAWMSAQTPLSGVARVTVAEGHAVALKLDGTVWAWGENSGGQLGDGSSTRRVVPVQASGLTSVAQVAAGEAHSVALKGDGTVWTWGKNTEGQLGDPVVVAQRATPGPVPMLSQVTAVAAGGRHTVALRMDGSVWTWGANAEGQLGDGTTTDRPTPAIVPPVNATAVAAGAAHTLAVSAAGAVWAWGDNSFGQLGDGTNAGSPMPVVVPGLTAIALAAGRGHSVALQGGGTVVTWGDNTEGQLGDGTKLPRSAPGPVPGLTGVVAVAAGADHSVALKSDGTVWAWGRNDVGQLGDGTTLTRTSPVQVRGVANARAVAAGAALTVVVGADDAIQSFGLDQSPAGVRLKGGGAFRRMDGALVATSRDELTSGLVFGASGPSVAAGRVLAPINLDEAGERPSEAGRVWTGTTSKGEHSVGNDCSGWSALTGTAHRGQVRGGPGLWSLDSSSAAVSCSSTTTRIICLGITSDTTSGLDAVPAGGKIGFLSPPFSMGAGGRAALDAHCAASRPSAYLNRNVLAYVATTTETAASRVSAANSWYRPDGTLIGTSQALQSGALEAGVWQTNTGDYVAGTVMAWTGASSPSALGMKSSTCENWTDAASTSLRGRTTSAGADAFSTGAQVGCSIQGTRLFCLER
jgi:alpha-tubulin suppressor-like RCC1 family protein